MLTQEKIWFVPMTLDQTTQYCSMNFLFKEPYPDITYHIKLRRRPLFYGNTVCPLYQGTVFMHLFTWLSEVFILSEYK